jgi:hypothetical protein
LSNPNVARPFVTYINNGTADTVITYVLQTTTTFLGCINTDTVRVTIKRAPIVDAGIDGNICSGDTIQIGSAAESGHSYTWSQPTNGGLSSTTISNPFVSTSNETTAPVINTYILNSTINGCSKTDTVRIQIYPSLKNVSAGTDQTLCFGSTATLGNSGDASQTYLWTPTLALNNGTISNPTFNYTNNPNVDTTLTYMVEVSNSFACKKYDTVTVIVKQAPIADAGADVSICSGDTTTIGGAAETNTSYQWTGATVFSPTTNSTNISLSNSTDNPVNTSLILTANFNGCIDRDTVMVQAYPSLKNVSAGDDVTICYGTIETLGNSGYANQTYLWTPATGLNSTTVSNPTFEYTSNPNVDTTITFQLEVSNSFSCKKYDQVTVTY